MTGSVASLWRHPIKSHGREELQDVQLEPGQCLPGDRRWAIAHSESAADGSAWVPCTNFSRGAKAPELMAIDASWDAAAGTVTLRHPKLGEITANPDTQGAEIVAWSAPLVPANRAQSSRVIRVPGRGMTDSDFPSIALNNLASHRVIAQRLGRPELSILRWRGNIWMDGLPPWEEADWIGREVQIGQAVLAVREQITRCLATTVNVETGQRDADTLKVLNDLGHQEFGVYAEVIRPGRVAPGDTVTLL
ncbi:MAG: MOSC domain-containing protein [Rhodobacteraceae bacterium]|nr:MOSC domain-containing protein [Paracoccaceae bacterium]